MSTKMMKSEKLKAAAAVLQGKMDDLQAQIRAEEEREKRQQALLQQRMAMEVERLVKRYQKLGLAAGYRMTKGPFAEEAVLEAKGLKQAEVVVDVPVGATPPVEPKSKSHWQKWCYDIVKPVLDTCERAPGNHVFSVARILRNNHRSRFWDLVDGVAGAEPLKKAEVEAALAQLAEERG